MTNRRFKRGECREQGSLLPARVEDYVGSDNPVRIIEAYVGGLDLVALGFRHAGRKGGSGQPPYDPAALLKLYLYGYVNQVRSSRRLEREARRNLEVIWLLAGLVPGYRTIGKFRQENWGALKAANREFVLLCRELDLTGGELVAIDGAFFQGDASKASVTTRRKLAEQLAAVEGAIEAYGGALTANDAAEEQQVAAAPGVGGGASLSGRLEALAARRAAIQADLAQLAASGETQLSRTDADARLLSKSGQTVAGYNVQIAVDDRHKLIVASDVVNDGNDTGQLHALASAAKTALGAETLNAVADAGYYNGETLKACEADGIVAYVPPAQREGRLTRQGRFSRSAFRYEAGRDAYRCPADALLRPMAGHKEDATGKLYRRYISRRAACAACPLRRRCLSAKGRTRTIYRWVHEDVIERHLARMADAGAAAVAARRSSLVEHPFGTLKCRAGYRHFLVRGLDKVRGEWSLMALCYNLTRVLHIVGFDTLIAYLIRRAAQCVPWLIAIIAITVRLIMRFTLAHLTSGQRNLLPKTSAALAA